KRIFEALVDVVLAKAKRPRLTGPLVAGPEAEDIPAPADFVERLHRFRDDPRIAVQRRHDPFPDLNPRGYRGESAGHGEAIPNPRSLPDAGRHNSSSGAHTVSKPIASARSASARISLQRAVVRSAPASPVTITNPILSG